MPEAVLNFPDEINGFSRVEYLSVFVSLLYAFSVGEFFSGWSRMLRNRDSIVICPDHLVFSGIYFWLLIINWYALWPRIEYLNEGFIYFIVTLLPTVITYLASVFIFPDFDKVKDLTAYYDKNYKAIMYFTVGFIMSNVIIALAFGETVITDKIVIIRTVNCTIMVAVAYFNLKYLRWPVLAFIALGLLIGTIEMAFIKH